MTRFNGSFRVRVKSILGCLTNISRSETTLETQFSSCLRSVLTEIVMIVPPVDTIFANYGAQNAKVKP
jgi:hypothetical protein